MRRLFLKMTVLAAVFLLTGVPAVFAASGDTLTIGGSVPSTLDLTVTPSGTQDNITLTGTTVGATATIASIAINTNASAGWELWVFAANTDGVDTYLTNADGDQIVYTIEYSGTGGAATASVPTGGVKVGEEGAPNAAETGDLIVTYDQSNSSAAGYYSDLLTVTLRAK
jgi:hypothetical protein